MLLPHVIRFNAGDRGAAAKYGRLARRCGLSGTARALASGLSRLRGSLGMPEGLVERVDAAAVARAALSDLCTPSNPQPVSAGELERLLKELMQREHA